MRNRTERVHMLFRVLGVLVLPVFRADAAMLAGVRFAVVFLGL